ncbi:LuxR family transcriptional regulator [Algibacter amylolyticus]|uniref:LuxR family transcriptional regulator n=1 Tax=Algibacter amylolyticus TaxID=1608400 RepID=A0A5M7BFS7_9FLAO|nr:triple tyrosine motif-containing protein [Algibacter amylolyticus]KAA5828202.1 LuxR family transcriptional regulator [Algibacter amylolyticus]TSJ82447.1 LuxR family transcriptional regulator [Algibacter amylolyticus]
MCLFFLNATTQERPPINVFYPEDYGAEPQNWSISQANSRFIYIANSKGLLEYNGAKWTVYDSPNQTNIRSVHVIDSLVYTGSYHDFGFWKKNNYGALKYTSISKSLKVDLLEDEEFWNIMSIDNSILFQSLDRIIIFNKVTSSYNIINSPTKISRLFKVDSSFYFQSLNNGLYKIENGNSVLVSNDVIIKNNVIVNIFTSNGVPIILTQDNGFFQLINNQLKPWISSASAVLKNISVFSSIQLKDGSFVLGTISNGLIHITQNGDVNYKINQSNGLTNNTILALYEDIDNNIWLGLDNGINCINIKSPYHIYYDYSGMIGSVYTSKVYNNMLYLGTNQGLFCKPLYSNENVEFLEGTQGQVWCLDIIDNTLFCGHNSGTFIVNNKQATKIANVQGTWQIKPISNHKDLLIQGNYNGLNILEKNNGQWQFRNKIKGFDISSRFFEFIDSNSVYLVHEYKGSFSIKIDKEFTKTVQVNQDSSMPIKLNSSLTKHYSDLLYSNNKGVFKYKRDSNKFAKDSVLSRLIDKDNFSSGVIVSDSLTNKLWSFSAQGIKYATLSSLSGENSIKSISFSEDLRKDVLHYESVTHIGNQKYLFGSTTGYIVLDLDKLGNKNHDITLNQIKVSTSQVNDTIKLVDITANPKFENNENNIQFSYSISEFSKIQKPEYQYKLEGIYNTWSDWSSSGTVLFKNLPFGDYTFSVRGRVGYQFTESTKSYTFHIQRPWYLSNLAFALYLLTLLLFTLLMHTIYKRYYRKQRERLMLRTTRELNLKELENKQQLMRFKNDKLREDIETKNRELGISTMNLIKKNEFLNTIKKELENVEGKNLNKVIKIIDKNLNNSDDWNLFQEAFNNADKDFLKKIKTLHPSLTANDLRLCAYLRLNLSSKEIAPLLNISTRSVEVKRYRLRKKMDLSHESSLTNYILEI